MAIIVIASCSGSRQTHVRSVAEKATGVGANAIEVAKMNVLSSTTSPSIVSWIAGDTQILVACSFENQPISILDVETGRCVQQLPGMDGGVVDARLSESTDLLAVAGRTGEIRCFRLSTREAVWSFAGDADVLALSWSADSLRAMRRDGSTLVVAGDGSSQKVSVGPATKDLGLPALGRFPDGFYVTEGIGTVAEISAAGEVEGRWMTGNLTNMAFGEGCVFAVTGGSPPIGLYAGRSSSVIRIHSGHLDWTTGLAQSTREKDVAVAASISYAAGLVAVGGGKQLWLLDGSSGEIRWSASFVGVGPGRATLGNVVLNSDGSLIAAGEYPKGVALFSVRRSLKR